MFRRVRGEGVDLRRVLSREEQARLLPREVERAEMRVRCRIKSDSDFALHQRHKEYIQSQFADRAVHRTYHALIEGRPKEMKGTAKEWLVEDKNLFVKRVKSTFHGSKEAITHWEITDTDNHTSLVQISIETGRRHQIRMAMRSLGCPVVGDELHGAESNAFNRVCLHASALEFLHPETDEPVRFASEIPFQ